ncbi:MAG: stage III sporulation protein AF [Clostridia bacterium]|nr:stage III sporulation protein AF [Clostridia bacterium]
MISVFKSLTGIVFISVILEMLLPEGKFAKYIRSVFGIVMLTVLISGITHIKAEISYFDFPEFNIEENSSVSGLNKVIAEEFYLSFEKQIRERLKAENIEVIYLAIDFDGENRIKKVHINIKESSVFKDKVIEILTKEFEIDEKTVVIGE